MILPALIHVSEALPAAVFDAGCGADSGPATMRHERIEGRGPVCIVDDDDWVCDSLTVLLETYGFDVRAYASGMDLLADERRDQARCLLIDQHMPGLGGLEVVAELRRQGITIPAILITGRLDPAIKRRAEAVGVRAILEKPFAVPRLIELIESALGPRA